MQVLSDFLAGAARPLTVGHSAFVRKFSPFMLAACLIFGLSANAGAAPIYYVGHNSDGYGNTGPNEVVGPRATPIDYSFSGSTYFTGANTGNVQATAYQGSLGIFASAHNNGGSALQRQEVTSSFTFDTFFGSAGSSPVNVSLNLMVAGMVDPGPWVNSTVQVIAGTMTQRSSGGYQEHFDLNTNSLVTTRSGMLSGFVDSGDHQMITTAIMQVPVNVPVQMFLQLNTIQPYATATPTIAFGNTLSLNTAGDVFTIHGGADVSVNSVDAGIVDNRFGARQATPIPEPAALTLFSLGLAGLGFVRRRRVT